MPFARDRFPGNVRVETNFTFDSHVLVLGDLDVERVVTASPAHAILMVAGSVRCCAMQLVRGYLFVAGNVIARECFLGCLYGLSKVAGRIETGVYLHDSSWANLPIDARLDEDTTTDNIEAGISIDIDAPNARATLASMVVPSALGDEKPDFGEGHVDLYALFDHIAAGVAAFRE